jgi:hypothetical protein
MRDERLNMYNSLTKELALATTATHWTSSAGSVVCEQDRLSDR